jgi:hypothetical protein
MPRTPSLPTGQTPKPAPIHCPLYPGVSPLHNQGVNSAVLFPSHAEKANIGAKILSVPIRLLRCYSVSPLDRNTNF